jgi:hypothetical protein
LTVTLWPTVRGATSARPAPATRSLGALLAFPALLAGFWGCGGATAPCPTPTRDLDRHRDESTAAQRELSRGVSEQRAIRARREEAARRAEAARASIDSLLAAQGKASEE